MILIQFCFNFVMILFQFCYNLVSILFDQNKTKILYFQFCSPKQNKITKILPKLAKQSKTKIKTQIRWPHVASGNRIGHRCSNCM